jgi:hypothetical protein
MSVNEHTAVLRAAIPNVPEVGVGTTADTMFAVRRELPSAGLNHVLPFSFTYNGVTDDIRENLTHLPLGDPARFKDELSLHRATGVFNYHFSKQIALHLDGKPVEKHWAPLFEDERARKLDPGTQLCLGMIAHIGGDLSRTVDEANASEDYINYDYPRIDSILRHRAYKVANLFVPLGGSKLITDTAMEYIVKGRKNALKDYYRMQGKSEDEKQAVVAKSHERTAALGNKILSHGYRGRFFIRVIAPKFKQSELMRAS